MSRLLPLAVTSLLILAAGCATGGALRADAREVEGDLEAARKQGALRCAPEALARGEANLVFGREELRQGDAVRARDHLRAAQEAAREALIESKGCVKEVIIVDEPAPEIVALDTDEDGILDADDTCPERPEDRDGFEDTDGCPDPDNDADGVPDVEDRCPDTPGPVANQGCPFAAPLDVDGDGLADDADACPDEPEDTDGYQDQDGCPDLDNDADGVPDLRDRCPMEAGIPETSGCPPTDRDGDGVADHLDRCPDEPGVAEEQGCPRKYTLVEIKKDRIEIRQKVHFATGKYRILPDSYALLDQVAQVLRDQPGLEIRIEGHTDSQGSDAFNLRLSQNRAESVRTYLIQQGIPPQRMEAVGFGEARPVASNATSLGREENRRVEFVITRR